MDLLYTILALLPSMILICQCTFLKYDPGRHYKYEYETSVIFGQNTQDKDSGKDVGFIINSEFMVELLHDSYEGQLFNLQILSVDVKSIMKPDLQRKLHSLSKFPVLFVLADGMVEKIYTADGDSIFSVNFKKGIVNLFQVYQKVGSRSEIDVSGECTATYSLSGSSGISKTLTDCENIELSGFHKRANPMLGVTVKPVKGFVYQISDGLIDSVTGLNRISATVNLRPNLNAVVSQRQEIKLRQHLKSENQIAATSEEDAVEKISSVVGSSYGMGMLPSTQEVQHCTDKCFSPSTLVSMYKDVLTGDKMASNDSASAFLTLVRGFRNVGKSTLEEVFTSKDGYYIVNQLIDVGVASQTESAQHALLDLLNFEDEFNIEYPERYLLATAFTSHPTDALLNNLITLAKKKVPSVELRESILLSLGAVINTYYREEANRKSPILQEYSRLAVDGLAGCGTDQEGCQLMYLRSLGNAGLPSTLQTLLRYSEKGRTGSVSTAAMQALRRFNMEDITHAALPVMQRIFHCTDRQYDIAVKSAALEVLLQLRVTPQDIAAIIRLCTPPVVDVEFSTYVLEKLQDSVKSNNYLRQTVTEALQDTRLNNYNTLAQKGLSSAVSSYLAVTPHVNATYGLYMANSKSGLMRLSSMQVQAFTTDDSLPLLNFGLYADGIDSLLGDEEVTEGGEEGPESNAGMSLTLMDVLLRPVEFFRGSSGLMSAVWNAPSDPVSALQANLLLQDHSERVHLSNGLVVELDVMGAASVDLSGSVSISLWNRNCHSLVTNSGAMLIEGGMRLDSEELTAGITFSAEGGSSIDFSTDVDFYEMPLKMCLQMSRPSFIFSEFYNKFEKHKTLRKNFSVKRKEQVLVNEASFILHKYNARQCRAMDLDQ